MDFVGTCFGVAAETGAVGVRVGVGGEGGVIMSV